MNQKSEKRQIFKAIFIHKVNCSEFYNDPSQKIFQNFKVNSFPLFLPSSISHFVGEARIQTLKNVKCISINNILQVQERVKA